MTELKIKRESINSTFDYLLPAIKNDLIKIIKDMKLC